MQSLKDFDPDPLLATMARFYVREGASVEIAVLANSDAWFYLDEDSLRYKSIEEPDLYCLSLRVSNVIYSQIFEEKSKYEKKFAALAKDLIKPYLMPGDWLNRVSITTTLNAEDDWQDKAKAWLAGKGVTNQGRVRSDNIAPKTCDGLLFRSEPEINLYKALKARGVSFAPLPVFIRGGEEYRRIEPDFVILKDGMVMVVEVDGDTFHTETPADAHNRTTMLGHEGAVIERVKASECATDELAKGCADKLLAALAKLKTSR